MAVGIQDEQIDVIADAGGMARKKCHYGRILFFTGVINFLITLPISLDVDRLDVLPGILVLAIFLFMPYCCFVCVILAVIMLRRPCNEKFFVIAAFILNIIPFLWWSAWVVFVYVAERRIRIKLNLAFC